MRNRCAKGHARASRPAVMLGLSLVALLPPLFAAQDSGSALVLEPTRVIEFTTDEGTWMSVDVDMACERSNGRILCGDTQGRIHDASHGNS